MDVYNDYLAHYGIKGQKWGIRRFQNEDGSYTDLGRRLRKTLGVGKEKRKPPESSKWRAKEAGYLSDEELNRRINRLNKEKQYKEMTKSRSTKAREWMSKTANTIFVAAAIAAASKVMQAKYTTAMKSWGGLPVDATKVASKALPRGAWHS